MHESKPSSEDVLKGDFDTIIVLGNTVIKKGEKKSNHYLQAKSRAIAAAEAYRKRMTKTLIFSGGKTSGEDQPSEAKSMKNYLQNKYKQDTGSFSSVPDDNIFLEEQSTNTSTNLINSLKIIHEKISEQAKIGVLTNNYHLPRAISQARKLGLTVEPISAEELLMERDIRLGSIMRKYNRSIPRIATYTKEFARRLLVYIDPKDKLSGLITPYTRGESNLNIKKLKPQIKKIFHSK